MAQRKQLTWTELRVGLFVILGLIVLAVAIFYVTGAGFLGPKYRIKTYLPEVSGLAPGAPVKLDGVVIGNVDDIQLVGRNHGKPPDAKHNIMVDMRLDKKYQDDILTDSNCVSCHRRPSRQSLCHTFSGAFRDAHQGRPNRDGW